MVVDGNTIIEAGKILSALGVIAGIIIAVIKWFQKQEQQSTDIAELKDTQKEDVEKLKSKHDEDMSDVRDELCLIIFGLHATLDGLKQQGCNGNVTKAHDMLEKHINKKAHRQ